MREIEGTISNDSVVPSFRLWFYGVALVLPLCIFFLYLIDLIIYIVPTLVSGTLFLVSLTILAFAPLYLSFANRIVRFTCRNIFIQERGSPISLVKEKNIQVTWDDVFAWRDSHYLTGISGNEFRSIDLVIVVEGKPKLYRTTSDNSSIYKKHGRVFNRLDYSFHNGEHIFFDEYKERLKPLLDTVPQDHELIDKLRYSNTRKGDILRIIGLVLILGSFIVGFAGMASGVGLPALALGFPAGLYALNESRKYFKDVSG